MLQVYCSFNRTFMELKCLSIMLCGWSMNSFNRTFMELKYVSAAYGETDGAVLIVPLWN